ncbi:MAG: hypothetical protein ABIN37_14810 [Burkholderiaceae bacterium]
MVLFLVAGEAKRSAVAQWRAGADIRARAIHSETGVDVLVESMFFPASSTRRHFRQRLEAGGRVEPRLIDATLLQTMECPVEALRQFVDVFSARCISPHDYFLNSLLITTTSRTTTRMPITIQTHIPPTIQPPIHPSA